MIPSLLLTTSRRPQWVSENLTWTPSRLVPSSRTDFGSGHLGLPTVNGVNLNDFVSGISNDARWTGVAQLQVLGLDSSIRHSLSELSLGVPTFESLKALDTSRQHSNNTCDSKRWRR